ncbi:MAG: hypothetical protein ACTSRT_16290 [Promethearchaeota archaeon]
MAINNQILGTKKGTEDGSIEFSSIPEQVLDSYLELLHPLSFIKRVLYRPFVGRWFPYIEVQSPSYWSQLSFFYGGIHARISNLRRCSRCFTILNSNNSVIDNIPISLCKTCSAEIYHGYWDCLDAILEKMFKCNAENDIRRDKKHKDGEEMVVCKDLLNPGCGFLNDPERMNPCLRNHAIGIIIFSPTKIGILIGRLDLIKYQMIWMGGIYGLILGYSNRIMNLEMLENVLEQVAGDLKSLFLDKQVCSEGGSVELIPVVTNLKMSIKTTLKPNLGINWLLFCFYNYYNDYNSKKVINTFLTPCVGLFRAILDRLMGKTDTNLEILDFFELHNIYAPLNPRLRRNIESILRKSFEGVELIEISRIIAQESETSLIRLQNLIRILEDEIKVFRIDELSNDLEIHGVLGSIGPHLIIDCDISETPAIIHLNDLIGREII